jgi:hypothetical protein
MATPGLGENGFARRADEVPWPRNSIRCRICRILSDSLDWRLCVDKGAVIGNISYLRIARVVKSFGWVCERFQRDKACDWLWEVWLKGSFLARMHVNRREST